MSRFGGVWASVWLSVGDPGSGNRDMQHSLTRFRTRTAQRCPSMTDFDENWTVVEEQKVSFYYTFCTVFVHPASLAEQRHRDRFRRLFGIEIVQKWTMFGRSGLESGLRSAVSARLYTVGSRSDMQCCKRALENRCETPQ